MTLETYFIVGAMTGLIIVEIILIISVLRLTKRIEQLRDEVSVRFNEVFDRLEPLLNALDEVSPIVKLIGNVREIFTGKKRGNHGRKRIEKRDETRVRISRDASRDGDSSGKVE